MEKILSVYDIPPSASLSLSHLSNGKKGIFAGFNLFLSLSEGEGAAQTAGHHPEAPGMSRCLQISFTNSISLNNASDLLLLFFYVITSKK